MKRSVAMVSLFAALALVPTVGCTTPESTEAHAAVAAGAKLVDVRTPEEYASGHLDGAVNIPFDEVAGRISEIGTPDTQVVVYCQSGGRSAVAAQTLHDAGFTKVIDVGPMHAW